MVGYDGGARGARHEFFKKLATSDITLAAM